MQINILVSSQRDAIITDFGSARRIRRKVPLSVATMGHSGDMRRPEPVLETTVCESTNTITVSRLNFTLRWAAPEVLQDEDQDIKADIWSFGWVCFEVRLSVQAQTLILTLLRLR